MSQKHASISYLLPNGMHYPVLPPRPSQKQQITVSLSAPLIERLRNAVYWTGHPSLVSLIAEALEEIVTEMEEVNGGAFPQRLSPLKRGRRQGKRSPVLTAPPRSQLEPDLHGLVQGSHDLLDGVLQSLFAVGLTLQGCKQTKSLRNGEPGDATLHQAMSQLHRVMHEIRNVMEGRGSGSWF